MQKEERIVGLEEMPKVASVVLSTLRDRKALFAHASVLALTGELGAGKTTFTKALAKLLGAKDDVTSPTFVIEKRYQTTDPDFPLLIHIDAYRLENEAELTAIRFEETLENSGALIVIEWAERVPSYIPQYALRVSFEHTEGETRHITYA